jgi:hypothetical protein
MNRFCVRLAAARFRAPSSVVERWMAFRERTQMSTIGRKSCHGQQSIGLADRILPVRGHWSVCTVELDRSAPIP